MTFYTNTQTVDDYFVIVNEQLAIHLVYRQIREHLCRNNEMLMCISISTRENTIVFRLNYLRVKN